MDGDLDITNNRLAIVHPGAGRATLQVGDTGERAIDAFAVAAVKKLVITGAVQGGDESGGAIQSEAQLLVSRSILRNNQTDDFGGAVSHTDGILTIDRSKLIGNTALDESGAINATGDRTVIRRSLIRGNRALDSQGGAIYAATELVVERSTFTGNRTVLRGGAIHIDDGEATITGSTFNGNRAQENGGAINSYADILEIANSTFDGNRARANGGAIWNDGNAIIDNITVTRNVSNSDNDLSGGAGGGIDNAPGGLIQIANSILALNDQRGGDADDCAGVFGSAGGNLRTDGTDCGGFVESGDAIRANPKLARLANNGGPTKTVALKPGSPAIGRAVGSFVPARDQRGRLRDGNPDSGAYERGA
jgi:predicted outer membrane repeat protein